VRHSGVSISDGWADLLTFSSAGRIIREHAFFGNTDAAFRAAGLPE